MKERDVHSIYQNPSFDVTKIYARDMSSVITSITQSDIDKKKEVNCEREKIGHIKHMLPVKIYFNSNIYVISPSLSLSCSLVNLFNVHYNHIVIVIFFFILIEVHH